MSGGNVNNDLDWHIDKDEVEDVAAGLSIAACPRSAITSLRRWRAVAGRQHPVTSGTAVAASVRSVISIPRCATAWCCSPWTAHRINPLKGALLRGREHLGSGTLTTAARHRLEPPRSPGPRGDPLQIKTGGCVAAAEPVGLDLRQVFRQSFHRQSTSRRLSAAAALCGAVITALPHRSSRSSSSSSDPGTPSAATTAGTSRQRQRPTPPLIDQSQRDQIRRISHSNPNPETPSHRASTQQSIHQYYSSSLLARDGRPPPAIRCSPANRLSLPWPVNGWPPASLAGR